jgi:hypothetical protein
MGHQEKQATSTSISDPRRISLASAASPSPTAIRLQSTLDVMALAHEMQRDMTRQGLVKDRKWHLKSYKACFLHQDGLRWLGDKVLDMEQSVGESVSGAAGAGCDGAAQSVCSSITSMEQYIDALKVKAARLGNLMIKAEYLSHVCEDHAFDVNHKSKALFFRFHMEMSVRQNESPSIRRRKSLSKDIHNNDAEGKRMIRSLILNHVEHPVSASVDKQHDANDNYASIPETTQAGQPEFTEAEASEVFSSSKASPIADIDIHAMANYSDAVSVMTMLTSAPSRTSSKSSADIIDDPDRVVDVGLFSIVRDFHCDLRFMKKIRDRKFHLKTYKKSFLHEDGMEWLSRQVRIHYYAFHESLSKNKEEGAGGGHVDGTASSSLPLPLLLPGNLTLEQAGEIAAKIGNLMIRHGYVSHVCGHHVFLPNMNKLTLFFKFRDKLIDIDYEKSCIGRYTETDIGKLQQTLFERETRNMLISLPPPQSPTT